MRTLSIRLTFLCVSLSTVAAEPINVGDARQLFFDDFLIAELDGVELRAGQPIEREEVLAFDAPWEGRYSGYVTIIHDDGYRAYYRGLPESGKDGSAAEVTCIALSDDGIRWTKPALGLHEVLGSRDNNVVLAGMPPFSHNLAPFLDANPDTAPTERYKALAGTSDTGLHGFVSADGLHWEKLDGALITDGAFDSQNVSFWSVTENQYVCYFRTWSEGGYKGFRSVSRTTSPDFRHWSEPVAMDFGDTPMEHLYTNQTQPYYRAPSVCVSLAARFMPGRRVLDATDAEALGVEAQYSGDCSDSVLMTSRGGNRYHRYFMEGFIKPGLSPRDWSSRTNYPACGVVPTGNSEMSFYVQRDYGQSTAHLVRYTLRPDGFAFARGPYTGGTLLTKPMRVAGPDLWINFATSAAGEIQVQLETPDGVVLPGLAFDKCKTLIGNFIERQVRWEGEAEFPLHQEVQVRFRLKDAELYSFQFRSAVSRQ